MSFTITVPLNNGSTLTALCNFNHCEGDHWVSELSIKDGSMCIGMFDISNGDFPTEFENGDYSSGNDNVCTTVSKDDDGLLVIGTSLAGYGGDAVFEYTIPAEATSAIVDLVKRAFVECKSLNAVK